MPDLDYFLDVREPAGRTLRVELEFDHAVTATGDHAIELFLPVWTPGSYLIREYARQVSRVTAIDAESGAALAVTKTTKNRWAIAPAEGTQRIRVAYSVYAHELTVRTADVTAAHAYWNPACVLLWPVDRPALTARLQIAHPPGWQAACALPAVPTDRGDLAFAIASHDQAVDSPALLGHFERLEFEVHGVAHTAVLDGLDGIEPPSAFVPDLRAIIGAAAEVFGDRLPYPAYTFLCLFADSGYGGLEHEDSCTLLMKRTAFADPKSYREFLALCSHELFHVWNVKRMRPAELWEFDYERENYTRMLWLAEGWTAYYDDLLCLRAGCFTVEQYLDVVAKNIERVLANPGRHRLSLAESSFDAWIRLYRPDENTRNSSQNYYVNGAVAAMCLDLTIRRDSGGERSLDDVLRELWRSTFEAGRGYELADVERAVMTCGSEAAVELLRTLTQGELEPPLAELLEDFGCDYEASPGTKPQLGVTFAADTTRIASVTAGSPADTAGLHPGDELVAIGNLRTTSSLWRDVFRAQARVDEPLALLIARRGVMETLEVRPAPTTSRVDLRQANDIDDRTAALRSGWLRVRPRPEA
ncbi:MAG: PDZ domain-containing protein [bacterium]|nr:PDZ domain-containing protein [bacterium]